MNSKTYNPFENNTPENNTPENGTPKNGDEKWIEEKFNNFKAFVKQCIEEKGQNEDILLNNKLFEVLKTVEKQDISVTLFLLYLKTNQEFKDIILYCRNGDIKNRDIFINELIESQSKKHNIYIQNCITNENLNKLKRYLILFCSII